MGIAERRLRDRDARRRLIIATARALAEREGWDAVTTRRLSTEIEYSQPVLYKHFASMEDIVEAVALEGFGELAEVLVPAVVGVVVDALAVPVGAGADDHVRSLPPAPPPHVRTRAAPSGRRPWP